MIRQLKPNFVASKYAPSPLEVSYWIDLSEDTSGNVIKSYKDKKWIPINFAENSDQSAQIRKLIQDLAAEVARATASEAELESEINSVSTSSNGAITTLTSQVNALESSKADVATTLSGYGITDACTSALYTQLVTAINDLTTRVEDLEQPA